MKNLWMVRAGEGGRFFGDFKQAGVVAVGFRPAGDFSVIRTLDDMRALVDRTWPDAPPIARAGSAAMAFKFRQTIRKGDSVVTYDPKSREYLVGEVTGDYEYAPGVVPEYEHIRRVRWIGSVSRDALSASSRNTLGSTLSVFQPGDEVLQELRTGLEERPAAPAQPEIRPEVEGEFQAVKEDAIERSREFIKDRVLRLSPDDMEVLVASVLRAMGYKARVTPKGPDRGRDVIASPDGLGFQQPRIIAEVKHRPREAMGSGQLRAFIGGLRPGDNGLFVSTGGYTREAHYEAVRAGVPITLIDLDDLADLVIEHYERFDADGRALLPLVKVYWPAS